MRNKTLVKNDNIQQLSNETSIVDNYMRKY